ncbi:hypothetical protein COCCADRAFT_90821, partial [Bipolaris zeicola 26-R-13]
HTGAEGVRAGALGGVVVVDVVGGCGGALGGECCRAIALPLGAVKECSRGAWSSPPGSS